MLEHLHQTPQNFGWPRARWTLALLQQGVQSLRALTPSGIWRRLQRWQIGRKRGRQHLSSPDPDYQAKLEAIAQATAAAREQPDQVALLYGDETTIYRRPPTGLAYHEKGGGGSQQPTAPATPGSNTKHRIGALLDVVLGQVLFVTGFCVGVEALCRLLHLLRAHYGAHVRLFVVWDNWPIHAHPQVLATAAELHIEILWLPTYAPWTNPIEKLWLKLKQEVVTMHRYSGQFAELKQGIREFLEHYQRPSPELLRFVGLQLPN